MIRKIVISGMGAVTPLGKTLKESWAGLRDGAFKRAPVTLFETGGCRCREAAEAEVEENAAGYFPFAGPVSRASLLALPALKEALLRADLLQNGLCRIPRLPMSISTTGGGMAFGEEFARKVLSGNRRRLLSPVSRYQSQQQVLDLQEAFGLRGHAMIVENACASGANALGHAADMIRAGLADCVIAGGYEALTELIFCGFDCLQAISPVACRPFDLKRDGLMLGEAAAFFVLESEEHARARGARALCELAGYGHTTDTHHLTQPSPDGGALRAAMAQAAERAGIRPDQIGYLNAHGTATPMNDGAEVQSYLGFFGSLAQVKISSTKAAIGHTLGAAGAVEAAFSICALREGKAPPQLNTTEPIPEIAASLVRVSDPQKDWEAVMSVNLGFGGSNAALIFKKTAEGAS